MRIPFCWYPFFIAFFRTGGASIIAHTAHQINEEIHDKEVRLISAQGEQLGIMPLAEALAKAGDADLDLVKISPNAVPPVCKLMDYGKYRFEQTKRDKEAKKNQRIVEIKEVRMSPGIDVNDFNVKVRNAQRFLSDGNRVKVAVNATFKICRGNFKLKDYLFISAISYISFFESSHPRQGSVIDLP